MKHLICMCKVIADNIRTLHHNLVGANWFGDHVLLGEYYSKIDDIEDAVIEMSMMNGGKDIAVKDAILEYQNLEVKEFTNEEAFALCLKYFMDLIAEIDKVKEELPADCVSELETFQYWLRLETKYKIAHRLAQ